MVFFHKDLGHLLCKSKSHPHKETTTCIINCNGIYISSQEQIAYFLTQEAVYLLVHFKFLRVYDNDKVLRRHILAAHESSEDEM